MHSFILFLNTKMNKPIARVMNPTPQLITDKTAKTKESEKPLRMREVRK
jgi:hypothetical protein